MRPFAPKSGSTVNISATTTSGTAALGMDVAGGEFQCRIHNAGSATAFVAFVTSSSGTATAAAHMPLPSGAVEVVTITNPSNAPITHAAAITGTGTATVYFTPGQGW